MAINKAEWAEIESKIARVDQAGIIEKQKKFENDVVIKLDAAAMDMYGKVNEKIIEIDEEAKKREAFLKENRFSTTLDSVLTVLENHGYDYKGYLISILKYTAKYCKMQEKSESYANWCKTREQGLTERATNKTIFDEFANKRKIL